MSKRTSAPDPEGLLACPLCESTDVSAVESVRVADLCKEYQRQFGLNVAGEFTTLTQSLTVARCRRCMLKFYAPAVAGSARFYAALNRRGDYYVSHRWEFDETLRRLPEEPDLIDVGCGEGAFLDLVPGTHKRGLEFNQVAAGRATQRGLRVSQERLNQLPECSADFMTLFQVIEHVERPRELIVDAARVLRKDGLLFVSSPNDLSYLGNTLHDPLNAPPHHVSRWRREAFEWIAHVSPFHLEHVLEEPLSRGRALHLYRRAQVSRLLGSILRRPIPLHRVDPAMALLRLVANAWAMASSTLLPHPPDEAVGPSMLAILRRD